MNNILYYYFHKENFGFGNKATSIKKVRENESRNIS